MKKFLYLIFLLPLSCLAGTSRFVEASSLKKQDQAAINLNFSDIDKGLSDCVHKATTETITGIKYFKANVLPSGTTTYDLGSSTKKWATLYVSTISASTISASTISASTIVGNSSVIASVGNGHGSTATMIRRFTTSQTTGTDITYADSATNGATFTINTAGIYAISYSDLNTAGSSTIGISVNASSLTATIGSTTIANGKKAQSNTPGANLASNTCVSIFLNTNDIVRAHTNGTPNSTADNVIFVISKVGL